THSNESKVLINVNDTRRPWSKWRGNGGFSSNQGTRSNSYGGKNKECSYCGQTNHIVKNDYRKHGFPPNYGRNFVANNASLESMEGREGRC
ncbi:hypothetical protein A2U01_0076519, partial [Trifolium medium]|nr:hypothetical protein [Trifolium medium]